MAASKLSTALTLVVLPLATAILGGGVGALLTYKSANREMDVKMVEIAVGILSQEPKDNIAPAREWAVDVISHYAEVTPSDAVRDALIKNKVVKSYVGYSYSYDYSVDDPRPPGWPSPPP